MIEPTPRQADEINRLLDIFGPECVSVIIVKFSHNYVDVEQICDVNRVSDEQLQRIAALGADVSISGLNELIYDNIAGYVEQAR